MRYVLFILLLFGCKSTERLAAERAQQERDLLRSLQGRYGDSTILAFPLTVPGGMITITQQTPCPDFDSGAVKSSAGVLTVTARCPDKEINVDSLIRNNAAYKAALVGRGLAEARADSLEIVTIQQAVKLDRQAMQLKWFYGVAIALLSIGLVLLFAGGKLSFITKLFR